MRRREEGRPEGLRDGRRQPGLGPRLQGTATGPPSSAAFGTLSDADSPGRWNNADQSIVFIGVWAGKVSEPTNVNNVNLGAGVSAGTYDVGFFDVSDPCTDEPIVTPTGCIGATECATSTMACDGGDAVVAFIVGSGTVTTAPGTGGCPTVTTSSVDQGAVTGDGAFECHVTGLVGAAVFGCLTIFGP